MTADYSVKNAIRVIDKIDFMLSTPTDSQFNELFNGMGADLMLESVSLDEIEHGYLGHECVSSDAAMFESITTTRMRLSQTMRAFIRKLNQGLSGTGILAGTNDTGNTDNGMPSIGGAEIGRVRRVGNIPVMVAKIPLSDGQSVSVIFHSPTSGNGRIQNDDVLTAFRFLLNKRDVSHVVAPINGRDISLPQVCQSLSNLIERNSSKFQRQATNAAKIKSDIDAELERADALEKQKVELIEKGDQLQQGMDTKKDEFSRLQNRLKKQVVINDQLRRLLAQLKNQQENKPTPADTGTTGTSVNDTGNTEDELSEVDKAASEAITFLKSVLSLESNNIQELAEIRTKTRAAISALNAATVYEENSGLVTDAVNHLSGLLATVAKSAMAGGQ
ncbi:internal head protein [Xenorhabdus entomophaga]|uniref:antirestriction phage head protein DarA n=1 Tax=Xenorhabdus entomophaga TaxID=3136257 RepID=UPI0030F3AD7E